MNYSKNVLFAILLVSAPNTLGMELSEPSSNGLRTRQPQRSEFGKNITVRPATSKDTFPIINLIGQNDAYDYYNVPHFVIRHMTSTHPSLCERIFLNTTINKTFNKTFVAEQENRVRAVLLYSIVESGFCCFNNKKHIDITAIATGIETDPSQAKGYLKALMDVVQEESDTEKYEINYWNPAYKILKRHGFLHKIEKV